MSLCNSIVIYPHMFNPEILPKERESKRLPTRPTRMILYSTPTRTCVFFCSARTLAHVLISQNSPPYTIHTDMCFFLCLCLGTCPKNFELRHEFYAPQIAYQDIFFMCNIAKDRDYMNIYELIYLEPIWNICCFLYLCYAIYMHIMGEIVDYKLQTHFKQI